MESDIPSNAPQSCPGTSSFDAGKSSGCEGCPNKNVCATASGGKIDDEILNKIKSRLAKVKNIIVVLSGKGGVGKSSLTACLAWSLASSLTIGKVVGVLDVDITGPTIPIMMGCEGETVHNSGSGWSPVFIDENLEVMSVGMLLSDPDQAIIWRGPKKNKLIENMLSEVDWSELDYLIIDTPPGTTDEHMSIVQFLRAAGFMSKTHAVIVSTNQEMALSDVRKQIGFCAKVDLPIVGVVGNMHNRTCSNCNHSYEIFPSATTGGVQALCDEYNLPLLAQLPLDSRLTRCLDLGISIMTEDDADRIADGTMDMLEMMIGQLFKAIKSRNPAVLN